MCSTTSTGAIRENSKAGKMSISSNRKARVNESPSASAPNSTGPDVPAGSATLAIDKPPVSPPSTPLDTWTQRMLANTRRMAMDEAYRRSIAQQLS